MFPHSQHLKLISNLLILLPANNLKFDSTSGRVLFLEILWMTEKKWSGGPTFLYSFAQSGGEWKLSSKMLNLLCRDLTKKGWGSESDCQLFLTSKQDVLPSFHSRTSCNNQTIHAGSNLHFSTCLFF